jgi:multidrug efflux pump subunit AcrB
MRIWLNPDKLQGYGLSATQVAERHQRQNVQFAAGSLGADPADQRPGFTATVSAERCSPRRNSSATSSCAPTATAPRCA